MPRHVKLNSTEHKNLKIRQGHNASLGDAVMFVPAFPIEFRSLQAHYPIAFWQDPENKDYRPIALLGFQEGENLFLADEDRWDASYLPLAIRMKPFLIGKTDAGPGAAPTLEVHVEMDHPRINNEEGEALFLPDGQQAPYLEHMVGVMGDLAASDETVRPLCALLAELQLFEPFALDVTLDNGSTGRLSGFHTISEERVQALSGEELARLNKAGALVSVFMVLASLSQFRGLIERKNARLQAGA